MKEKLGQGDMEGADENPETGNAYACRKFFPLFLVNYTYSRSIKAAQAQNFFSPTPAAFRRSSLPPDIHVTSALGQGGFEPNPKI